MDFEYKRVCKICGEPFITSCKTQKICDKQHYRHCKNCGTPIPFKRPSDRNVFCSRECSRAFTKKQNIEKYGVEHPMQNASVKEHFKESMLRTYGVESPLQSDAIKQRAIRTNQQKFGTDWAIANQDVYSAGRKTMEDRYGAPYTLQSPTLVRRVKDTMQEKYGADNPTRVPEIVERIRATNIAKYGVPNPMQLREIADKGVAAKVARYGTEYKKKFALKSRDTVIRRYGVTNVSYLPSTIDKITDTFMRRYGVKRAVPIPEFAEKMKQTTLARYGVPYFVLTDEYLLNNGHFVVSTANRKFARILEAYGIHCEFEYVIGTKRYDVFIPSKNVVIELDPTYTHNTIGNHWNHKGISPKYHLDKTNVATDAGYRCIHIFDWDNQFDIVNLLLNKQRIQARACSVKEISDTSVIKEFETNYHLQGYCRGQTVCYGLYYQDELMQIMTFGLPRYNKNYQWELLRLCTKTGYYVIGGAERLFKHFLKDHDPSSIISYCDKAKFSGDVYSKLGFTHHHDTAPTKVWSHGSEKITNNLLLRRGFDQLFNTDYGKGADNEELMLSHGWLPVYDCGQGVYVWRKL